MAEGARELDRWLDREYAYAATAMLAGISPVHLVHERPGFGQTMRAKRGSIVASPVLAAWDPEPDYFFHWYRDSSVVVDALRLLYEDGTLGDEALTHLTEFVRFSLSLEKLDGRELVANRGWRARVIPEFRQYERSDEELSAVHGKAVAAESRVNPDGTIDISKWARPQLDGTPMRAVALLRWIRNSTVREKLNDDALADLRRLVRTDLEFTAAMWNEPSFDIWEEELGHHYYTMRIAAAALEDGAEWMTGEGRTEEGASLRAQAAEIFGRLDALWNEEGGYYRARVLASGARSQKELDISAILAAVHASAQGSKHSARDPRMHSTLQRLESLFDAKYAINRNRPPGRGVAMGRYELDAYFSGGAYYFSTLGAAEFCFQAAAGSRDDERRKWIERGDGFLEMVREFTPDSGDLSEQFDQTTGVQTSARHLTWSYAAFISSVVARRVALRATTGA